MMSKINEEKFGENCIILESWKAVLAEAISARVLSDMDQAVSNVKKDSVSEIIDLSDF